MSAAPGVESGVEGRVILVVDDVRFTRLTVVRMLQQMGCTDVHEAEEGVAALNWLSENQADCLIADVLMPGMSGLELLKTIRVGAAGIRRDLPIVFLTGQSELGSVGPALLLGLDELITKPVGQQGLLGCLKRVFDPQYKSAQASVLAEPEVYRRVDLSPLPGEAVSELTSEDERPLPLAEVRENSVLTRDLLYVNGRLLLPAGVRLSAPVLSRLRELAARSDLPGTLWVAG